MAAALRQAMTLLLHPRLPVLRLRAVVPLLLALGIATALPQAAAQPDTQRFPSAAIAFIDAELPAMEAAIAARDRDYFEDAMGRVLTFSEHWGFKAHENPALARFATCTEAVSDFLVVGMCRILTTSEACEPALATRFETNLGQCRALAVQR